MHAYPNGNPQVSFENSTHKNGTYKLHYHNIEVRHTLRIENVTNTSMSNLMQMLT